MKGSYRADHIGSLLRPAKLLAAHKSVTAGALSLTALREIEDECILAALAKQREIGLDVLSDGEFRRSNWTGDFTALIEGFVPGAPPIKLEWHGDSAAPHAEGQVTNFPTARIIGGELRKNQSYTRHESVFLSDHAGAPFKVTMPAPSYLVARSYVPSITGKIYPTRAAALGAVAELVRDEIQSLVKQGVPYIQIDNPHYPDYLMENIRSQWRALGIDPDRALLEDVEADNACVAGLDRTNVTIGMHFCRGNGGEHGWHSTGSYEPVAEQVFGGLDYDRLLLEYDSERAGGFEPLRFVRKNTTVVLGLVTTKRDSMEQGDDLRRRVDEAAKFVPLENLALSPQCGFASVLLGNALTAEDQWRKLALVTDTARKIWGK